MYIWLPARAAVATGIGAAEAALSRAVEGAMGVSSAAAGVVAGVRDAAMRRGLGVWSRLSLRSVLGEGGRWSWSWPLLRDMAPKARVLSSWSSFLKERLFPQKNLVSLCLIHSLPLGSVRYIESRS